MSEEKLHHTQQLAAVTGDPAQAGQGNHHFFALGRLQQLERVAIEPGIDAAENDSREGIGWQLDVLGLRRVYHLARVRQARERHLGRPVAHPAAAADHAVRSVAKHDHARG